MKRSSISIITGILLMACGFTTSIFSTPTNTPQPTATALPPSPTPTPKPESITFPEVSDAKISENPESVVLLKEISLDEIPAFKDSKDMVFDFKNKRVAMEKDGMVEIWGFEDGELHLVHSLDLPAKTVGRMAFSPTGNKIVVHWNESSQEMLQLWDTNSWTSVDIGSLREDFVSFSFSPDENQLAVSGSPLVDKEGTIELWDTNTGGLIKILPPLYINDGLASDGSIVMAYSPDGTKIASTYSEPASPGIELWDINKDRRIFTLGKDGGGSPNITFSPDGRFLASTVSVGGNVQNQFMILWDISAGKQVKDVQITILKRTPSDAIVFSPDGKQLAIANDGVINLLDMDTLNIRQKLESAGSEVEHLSQVEYLLDGRLLVSVGSGKIRFWGIP